MFLLLVCGVTSASGAGEPDPTVAEEKALLRNVFASQLETIDADPARVLGDVAIDRIDSPTEALVTMDGDRVLLESEIPLRAPEEDGDLSKVDLALREDPAGGFSPANPLVDLTLPESADEPIAVGENGLTLSLEGAQETTASPLGEEDLFLPEAREDTSLLLSPISGGLELSAMLLSPSSPERLSFAVNLPAGEKLRGSEEGGAEVLDAAGEVVARVSVPRAVDAEGEVVPAELSVEGDSLVLSVSHREADVAYPLFVDPEIIEENWSGFTDTSKLNYWFWQYSGVGSETYIGWRSCISHCWGNGLYVRARTNTTYPAGSYGRWGFVPQGTTTYMRRVVFGPMHFDPHGCTGNEPHGYVGVWNTGGFWSVLAPAYPSGLATWVDSGEQNLGAGARTAFVAIHSAAATTTTCGRDYHLGGATLFLEDPENASVGTPSYPSGWVKDKDSFTVNVPVSDPGLGVKSATISPAGADPITKTLTCTAHYNDQCPPSYTFPFAVTADSFDQGEKVVDASATDAIGHGSNTASWTMKVDRTPPEVELDGQLAEATDETGTDEQDPEKWDALTLPVYNLQIGATDGSTASAAAKRSGVKSISVYLDGKAVPEKTWTEASCPASSCPMSRTFTLKLNELSADTHHVLRVYAQDFAGNTPRERKIEFEYIPATGIKEGDVMQYFPLPDGQGNEEEEEHPSRPELAVNVLNGNLVYRQQDAEVQGVGADLGLDLYYNSLLPESQNSEWGDGWTLSQTPDLELEAPEAPGPATEATVLEESGGVESKVDLPSSVGEEEFDKRLQATVTREAGGDYGLTDESGETGQTLVFDESGRVEEARNGSSATVDYEYEEGSLAGLSIEDPGTAMVAPGTLEEGETLPRPEIEHLTDLGASGTADGQLDEPADVVADPQGDLWILDAANKRVQHLGPDGQFLSKFGTPGTAQGQINDPTAIAIDGSGNLLVAESYRVQKFSPAGQFLSSFGSAGFGNGKLFEANAIAVGADGSIWVSDSLKVQRFSAAGQFIERVSGAGPGELVAPKSLDVDGDGNVFAVDPELDLVKVYNPEGDFLRQFGSSGSGAGQLSYPTAIDADSDGYVWVADDQLGRVQLFDSAGDYIAQFESPGGSEPGLRAQTAISSDGKGRVWISDREGDRVEVWLAKSITGFFAGTDLGASGTADGQLDEPADVLADPQGDLWILDAANKRVQHLGPDGQFLSKFGTPGTAQGQINDPTAIAIDGSGNLLVAESYRVQKFSPAGQFLSSFGSAGFGNGKLFEANAIAVGADGSIWVSDSLKVQRFSAAGQFIERVSGPGAGELVAPKGLDVDGDGNVFAVDPELDLVKVYNPEGDFLRQFGSSGSAPGQLSYPTAIDADSDGYVWVTDDQLGRVQLFDSAGDYIAQFESPGGSEPGVRAQTAISSDGKGRVWISDREGDRIATELGGRYEPSNEPALTGDDPQLEVDVSEGLVDSVEGDEVGTLEYAHSGDLLTAVSKPEGEVAFSYDEAGRMTKVTLPNGTYGEVAYEATYGRVKSVTVSVEGATPKTTYFEYSDEPRRTTVTPPDAPATTYDISASGSVFKWSNAKQPPIFDDIAGTLYDVNNRETSEPIGTGAHNLVIQAHSDEGIASIQIIANDNQLVDEKTCAQDPETPGIECVTQEDEWVTETGSWAPGILYLEVLATDRLGQTVSERFWVNIPYTPPPDPEAEEPPSFNDILKFREEFGLDLDLKGNEIAINDRVFELMGAWNNPNTPAGEVARASSERWGVPLRQADTAEMEYRDWYLSHDSSVVMQWGEGVGSQSYAGYYVDNRAGGIINVSLLGNSAEKAALLASISGLRAPVRIRVAPENPLYTEAELRTTRPAVAKEAANNPQLTGQIGNIWISPYANKVIVPAVNPSQAEAVLQPQFGSKVQAIPGSPPLPPPSAFSRRNTEGRVQAGDYLASGWECTAGFGAWDALAGHNGERLFVPLQLTGGHCFEKGVKVYRGYDETDQEFLGRVTRNNFIEAPGALSLDAETIHSTWPEVARSIYINPAKEKLVDGYETPVPGQWVCLSGLTTDKRVCGPVLDEPKLSRSLSEDRTFEIESIEIPIGVRVSRGDSGGPAWIMGTGQAAGLITGAEGGTYGRGECVPLPEENYICPIARITTIQQIVSGAKTLYNAEKLSKEVSSFPEPLYIDGVTVGK